MEEIKDKRGGHRPGAGRPATVKGLVNRVGFRLSDEAVAILDKQPNKSAFIDQLIIKSSV